MTYGTRYLKIDQFISYCGKLNVKTDEKELEHYEKENIMLPMIRILKPEEYVKQEYEWFNHITDETAHKKWPEIQMLYDHVNYKDRTYDELIDSFDRQIDHNPYIFRPNVADYKPWETFEVIVYQKDYTAHRSMAEHYYCYWQVHQLYLVQQYPDLYQNYHLLNKIRETSGGNFQIDPRAYFPEVYRNYKNMSHFYDALSFFITMYTREQQRTFALIPEKNGFQTLTEKQHKDFLERLSAHAKLVQDRFSLAEKNLFDFLIFLLNTRLKYKDAEKMRLANEMESDIIYQAKFIWGVTGKEWEEVATELGNIYPPFQIKQSFRHLNSVSKAKDNAHQMLEIFFRKNEIELKELNLSINDIDEILSLCENKYLFLFFYTLDDMFATEEEIETKFSKKNKYISLKNLASSLEYFLKILSTQAVQKGRDGLAGLEIEPLEGLIEKIMAKESTWIKVYKGKISKGISTQKKDTRDFYSKLTSVHSLKNKNARSFLIALITRNFVTHQFSNDDRFYGDFFGKMFGAILYCIFYSWHVAKREKWV